VLPPRSRHVALGAADLLLVKVDLKLLYCVSSLDLHLPSLAGARRASQDDAGIGNHIADEVARFGGSWTFIITFGLILVTYTSINIWLRQKAWDPYPFILLNLILSCLAALQGSILLIAARRADQISSELAMHDYQTNLDADQVIKSVHQLVTEIHTSVAAGGNTASPASTP